MKKIIVSMFIVLGGVILAAPAFACESTPIACAVDSDGNTTCEDVSVINAPTDEPPVPVPIACAVDSDGNTTCEDVSVINAPTDEPVLPVCTEDMSACERGAIMYDKSISQTSIHVENIHQNETWWDIFTDPKHIAAELGWTVIQDFVVLWLLYGVVFKKCILPKLTNRIHAEIDKEHGIEHE